MARGREGWRWGKVLLGVGDARLKEIRQPLIWEGDENRFVSNGHKQHCIIINENIFVKIFGAMHHLSQIKKYSFCHNHSISIFISLGMFPGPIINKYVKSSI